MRRLITIFTTFVVVIVIALAGLLIAGALWTPPGEVITPAGVERNTSHYIAAADGTRIAAEVWLPADAAAPVPVVLEGTRYWRAMGLTAFGRVAGMFGMALPGVEPDDWVRYFNAKGYAYVRVDVRGTGASFGVHTTEYAPAEVEDFRSVLDWLTAQPWSTGQVFATGVSYSGTLAELMTATGHPALLAAAPLYSDFDAQMQLVRPGGALQPAFTSRWSRLVAAMDANDVCGVIAASEARDVPWGECAGVRLLISGVKPVDGQWSALKQAVAEHNSPNVLAMVEGMEYRDSPWAPGLTSLDTQAFGRKQALEDAAVPLYVLTGWFDAATSNGALARFTAHTTPQSVWIAPFDHGGAHDTDPFNAADADPVWSQTEQLDRVEAFFRRHLEGRPVTDKTLHYYVMGGDGFRSTDQWPPAHLAETFYYFDEQGALSTQAPATTAYDTHQVDFETGTGERSRWITQLGGSDVDYSDNQPHGLTYASAALPEDMELTGSPILDFWMTSTERDGALHAYLEAISPTGKAHYLTEGVLRLLHRANTTQPFYPKFGPAHSFVERDARPMPTGRIVRVTTTMLATSARIPAGFRLRLRLTGADRASFARYPAQGEAPRWHVYRGPTKPSSITLPLAPYLPQPAS